MKDLDDKSGVVYHEPSYLPIIISHLDEIDVDGVPSPEGSLSSKLVLHFDINETILVGDDAGGDTVEDCLNKVRFQGPFSIAIYFVE